MDPRTQLLKGVLPLATLAVLSREPSYGYRILHDLRSGGLDPVADASVYGTLQRLFDDGLLESHVVASDNGPARRYYSLTGQGVAALRTGRGSWAAFTEVINRVLGQVGGLDVVHR